MKVDCVPATMAHALELALTMREADRTEVLRLSGLPPLEALEASLRMSTSSWTVLFDGKVAAMLGSGPTMPFTFEGLDLAGFGGCAWALTSDEVTRHPMTFARHSKGALQLLWNDFDYLVNWVDAAYESALAWLERLGFQKSGRPEAVGQNGDLFYLVVLRRT